MFFFNTPSFGSNMTKAIFAFLNLGSFNLFSASSLSENRETALVTHSSIPNPLKTLSGCIFLCEKKSSVVTGLPLQFYNNSLRTASHPLGDIVQAMPQTILHSLFFSFSQS